MRKIKEDHLEEIETKLKEQKNVQQKLNQAEEKYRLLHKKVKLLE